MKHPVKVYLEKGKTYHFCTCGKSADGVLCDGSHKGASLHPKRLSLRVTLKCCCACVKRVRVHRIVMGHMRSMRSWIWIFCWSDTHKQL